MDIAPIARPGRSAPRPVPGAAPAPAAPAPGPPLRLAFDHGGFWIGSRDVGPSLRAAHARAGADQERVEGPAGMVTLREDQPSGRTASAAGSLSPCPPLLCGLRVPPDLRAAVEARGRVVGAVRGWGLPLSGEVLADLELCAGEVLANAVVHTGAESRVLVQWTGRRLRVEVRDASPRLPHPVPADGEDDDEDEGGRGLLLVAALADRWGACPSGTGKTVWFELDTAG